MSELEVVSAVDLLAEIERLSHQVPKGIVAFDGDGTTWSGDVGEDFFASIVAKDDFRPEVIEPLRAEARAFGLPDDGGGQLLAKRLHAAYVEGTFPEERICEVIAWSVAGWTVEELRVFCAEEIQRRRLIDRIHPEVQMIFEGARGLGIPCYLVSASPQAIVEAAGAVVGVAPSHVVGARPAVADGIVRAWAERPIPYGAGKVHNLAERTRSHEHGELLAAFGDNVFDTSMLAHARLATAVRPKPRLLAAADQVPGLRVLGGFL